MDERELKAFLTWLANGNSSLKLVAYEWSYGENVEVRPDLDQVLRWWAAEKQRQWLASLDNEEIQHPTAPTI